MHIRSATGALLLALAASVACSTPAPAADPEPGTGTVVLSNEAYDSLVRADEDEQELILTNPSYREAWLFCLGSTEPSHVERNAWGQGYVCIPDGAVQ
ncbi:MULTISPECIES: hypothetical protein [unclassified Streptomyces]|uniref:hypothetical protein n=1 Tax=unclassified Streptomyces TaxID=2593676 RepID=UPI002E177929|nr:MULTISPECIES: hypothetical protein [unclassified Streptomyces]